VTRTNPYSTAPNCGIEVTTIICPMSGPREGSHQAIQLRNCCGPVVLSAYSTSLPTCGETTCRSLAKTDHGPAVCQGRGVVTSRIADACTAADLSFDALLMSYARGAKLTRVPRGDAARSQRRLRGNFLVAATTWVDDFAEHPTKYGREAWARRGHGWWA
jgi:hypothetical protein